MSEGTNKARLGEAGAGSSPAGGNELASLSHSLTARRETRSPVISPPPSRHAPPQPPARRTALPKARMKNGNGKPRSPLPTLGN